MKIQRRIKTAAILMILISGAAGAAPSFDIATDTALSVQPDKVLQVDETFQCLAACLEEKGFECKGADFTPHSGQCRLTSRADTGSPQPDTDFYTVTDDGKGRGDSKCFSGGEKSGALCYDKCRAGYVGRGPVCWQKCPAGYVNDGAICRKPAQIDKRASKGRGVGKPMGCASGEEKDGGLCYDDCKSGYRGVGPVCWQKCLAGQVNDGVTCREKGDLFTKKTYGRGRGKIQRKNCSGDCEKKAGLWYPKCKSGYNGVGPVCWQKCPSGYKNDGATCRKPVEIFTKKSYGRGVGKPLHTCAQGWERNGALCYPGCPAGYKGVGPVCWKDCPPGHKTDGATCRQPGETFVKKSYGRGAGYLQRGNYQRIFYRYIRDHNNVNKAYGKPLTEPEKTFLSQFFPKWLVDKMRIVMKKRRTGFGNYDAGATTYGDDLIVIKEGHRNNGTLKHEMVHACQYAKLGEEGFAHEYADQYVESGYDYNRMSFEEDAADFVIRGTGPISQYLGADHSRGAIYAACKD